MEIILTLSTLVLSPINGDVSIRGIMNLLRLMERLNELMKIKMLKQ